MSEPLSDARLAGMRAAAKYASPPPAVFLLLDEVDRLRAAVSRVRELHQRCERCGETPDHCTSCDGLTWPCATLLAISGSDAGGQQ